MHGSYGRFILEQSAEAARRMKLEQKQEDENIAIEAAIKKHRESKPQPLKENEDVA